MRAMATLPTALHPIKTKGQQVLERRIGEPIEVFLRRRYVVDRATQDEIAADLGGLDRATVSRWLRDFGITRLDRA